jgi:very-short-patch-repair endonuclease
MPELNTITDRLEALGLGPLLNELIRRNTAADEALKVLRFSWYSSLLDEYRLRVPYLANFSGREHSRIVEEFKKADVDHLALNAQRVRSQGRRASSRGARCQYVVPKLGDFESILKCLAALVPQSYTLTWHYRSYDERLITFSYEEIYKPDLVTFPSCNVDSPLCLAVVEGSASPGSGGVVGAEVQRVVELVLQHIREYPDQTLGVITMGLKHANPVEAALRAATSEHPELTEFTARMQDPGRRLFVKSLEDVHGDQRDVIILSMGYSKGPDGRLRMQFGPINQEGGERRLNVAVTRARRRMCVVSSFTHHGMPADWPTIGPRLLRRFLEFASNGGRLDEVGKAMAAKPNGFERNVAEALDAHGIPFVREWGVSGYRIDFALIHPDQPGRMVLAVEADGDRYHNSLSARDRDRLRQEHLERLGWRFHRVWASEWFSDPHAQIARIVQRWREASAEPLAQPPPRPAPTTAPDIPGIDARRGPRPPAPRRGTIDEYGFEEIVSICRWLLQDGLLLNRDTRIDQAIEQLGFQRRGSKIVQRIDAALDRAEQTPGSEPV